MTLAELLQFTFDTGKNASPITGETFAEFCEQPLPKYFLKFYKLTDVDNRVLKPERADAGSQG